MKLKFLSPAALLALVFVAFSAHADKNSNQANFETFQGSKKTADSTYVLDKNKNGIKVRSNVTYLSATQGASSNSYKVGTDGIIDDASIRTSADKTLMMFTPNKANDELSIDLLQDGKAIGGHKVAMKAPTDFIIAFHDDPSAFQVLVDSLNAHPHADGIYMLMVPPKGTKAGRFEPYMMKDKAEAKGKFNGEEITLTEYTLRFNSGLSHIYTDKDGNLMQAEIKPLNIRHTRKNFELVK
ncbi:MAG: hypothetical protein PW792_12160 [Acidobacteriaceae bacterium]|nr:hypothetical protein [Acidobacteriaceae bacterium]